MTTICRFCVIVLTILMAVSPAFADDSPSRLRPNLTSLLTDPKQHQVCWQVDCSLHVQPQEAFAFLSRVTRARGRSRRRAMQYPHPLPARQDEQRIPALSSEKIQFRPALNWRLAREYQCVIELTAHRTLASCGGTWDKRVQLIDRALPQDRVWRRFADSLFSPSSRTRLIANTNRHEAMASRVNSTVAVRRYRRGGLEESWIARNVPG